MMGVNVRMEPTKQIFEQLLVERRSRKGKADKTLSKSGSMCANVVGVW